LGAPCTNWPWRNGHVCFCSRKKRRPATNESLTIYIKLASLKVSPVSGSFTRDHRVPGNISIRSPWGICFFFRFPGLQRCMSPGEEQGRHKDGEEDLRRLRVSSFDGLSCFTMLSCSPTAGHSPVHVLWNASTWWLQWVVDVIYKTNSSAETPETRWLKH
jgi:hypothetical protein